MKELTDRQKNVLRIIVSTYVKAASPVGSRTISKFFHDEISPATIRNEMHELEEREFIKQPHTSAGRVPTDKGYRYYVDCLMPETKVAPHVATLVAREFRNEMDNMDMLIERTSRILSTLSEQAGFVVFPSFEHLILKRIELARMARQHLLVVWVTENGFVQNQVIDMKEEIPDSELLRIGNFLNCELQGVLLEHVKDFLAQKMSEAQDSLRSLFQTAASIISESFPRLGQKRLALEGSRYILEQPEFRNWEKSRQLFRMLESKESLVHLLDQSSEREGVHVQIGVEHHCADIWDCSFVSASYRMNQKTLGTLGILGPRRMPYDRVISLVDLVSRRLGEVLEQW